MTEQTLQFGQLTEHAVGVILKEMVRRAIESIQAHQFSFEVQEKYSPSGKPDFVTSADHAAQDIYLRMIQECLPGVGVIAEEDNLRIPCPCENKLWITVDPLDGTRAFMRKQSHGVGTMVALLNEREVISAYVGDVMTREIYGFRPGSDAVHRISKYNLGLELKADESRPLREQHVLLHAEPRHFSEAAQALFLSTDTRVFRSFEITRGSVGIEFTRLWKGEVGGILIRALRVTPWDFNPIFGICKRMGFVFLEIHPDKLSPVELPSLTDLYPLQHEMVIVHESKVEELQRGYRA